MWTGILVPPGYRAIVRSAAFANPTAAAVRCVLDLAGVYVLDTVIPASSTGTFDELRHVAYAGEGCSVWLNAGGVSAMISGYFLQDPGGRRSPAEVTFPELDGP